MVDKPVYAYNGNLPQKNEGQQMLEAAIYGFALGVAIGAIALYLSQKQE